MEMIDMKEKKQKAMDMVEKDYYPTLHLSAKQFPPLDKKKFGDTFRVTADLKVRSVSQYNNEKKDFGLDIIKMGVTGKKDAE